MELNKEYVFKNKGVRDDPHQGKVVLVVEKLDDRFALGFFGEVVYRYEIDGQTGIAFSDELTPA